MLPSLRFGVSLSRSIFFTPIRHGSGRKVGKHGKPRWIPVAPSKEFILPPQDRSSQEEKDQYDHLWDKYRDHYSAVSQFLWEEHLKNSAVGEAAKLKESHELEEQNRLIMENEAENARIAALRKIRLENEACLKEEQIKAEVLIQEAKEVDRIKKADQFITQQAEEFKDRVTLDNLVLKIEKALDSPVDYEYAIDKEGHIYKGRYTKSILVPSDQREKIEVPKREDIYIEVQNS
ncbi:MRPS26 [Lepeophtheirus salmonis]|uniref:Small ribosomal subunit protein mS26 n=1 Tax=Lepeophtheirus salmonis TaxID=72036 RepID=A0A0K2UG75_LEPSM|nr:probable 28S ribosomal protein S26, mitochondrial [Lepeophtheirus salmonis]CAB4061310.1 MRPS26 [Lepeophtheirus salmonis]CAF2882248.1 MRPS26 [Lepeophtheirus salmonis]